MFKEIQYTVCSPTVWITEPTFSRAWYQLHVFLHLALVACFPALDTGYMFSCTWYWLHVFLHLTLVVIYQTQERVFHQDIQTPRSGLKKRGAAEFF